MRCVWQEGRDYNRWWRPASGTRGCVHVWRWYRSVWVGRTREGRKGREVDLKLILLLSLETSGLGIEAGREGFTLESPSEPPPP